MLEVEEWEEREWTHYVYVCVMEKYVNRFLLNEV